MRKRKFSLQQLAQFSFKSLPFRQVVCFCVQHFHWFASIGYCERPLCSVALLHAMYVYLDLEEICVVNMSELTMQTNLTVCARFPHQPFASAAFRRERSSDSWMRCRAT